MQFARVVCWTVGLLGPVCSSLSAGPLVAQYGIYEAEFESSADTTNPYTDQAAHAESRRPDGSTWIVPLFWDGDSKWKLRFSPDMLGEWSYAVRSQDPGLNGRTGSFTCQSSQRRGSIQPMAGHPHHFQYQNGEAMWLMGDTAWALLTDSADEQHDRAAAEDYLRARAAQGFNAVHTMVLSEAGWGNARGMPFVDLSSEEINPGYWQEVDRRVAHANSQGLVVGLALAWGDKRKREPFAWRRFPNLEARKRYARYIAARYAAYDVYFLVAGEWHAEIRTRPSSEVEIRTEFIQIGDTLAAADPHDRMIGIHPMTQRGSVREFNDAAWMSFGDYQQNYRDLHARLLESRRFNKPIVNAEYGYLFRDRDGDGKTDKDNSTSIDSMRHASWDIVMAGGYLISGFGSTYFGGNRDPGPFHLAAPENDEWEQQVGQLKRFFVSLDWWKLQPHDELLACSVARSKDGKRLGRITPPATTYWMLAEPGRQYIAYARGLMVPLTLQLGPQAAGAYRARWYNPRTGDRGPVGAKPAGEQQMLRSSFDWTPPSPDDWVLHLSKTNSR